jgi:hypothetical protein
MGVAAFGGFGGRGFIDDCDQRYGAVGAVADARSQTVAVVRIHQARYSARNLDDSFCTGSGAGAAAIALGLVDGNCLPLHGFRHPFQALSFCLTGCDTAHWHRQSSPQKHYGIKVPQ